MADMKSTEKNYGTVGILIHWFSAALILILIGSGFRAGFATDAGIKSAALMVHVPVAILVLVLTVTRMVWWWRFDRNPDGVAGVPPWQELVARWTHRGLYALLLLMLASGIALSVMSGLPQALFGAATLPEFSDLPPRAGHGFGARVPGRPRSVACGCGCISSRDPEGLDVETNVVQWSLRVLLCSP